jgi:DNA-binding transcriptional MocR family regulator
LSLNRDQFVVVLAALRQRFREGEWVEGEPLTVSEIATECGVSATPVREALARLAGEGLVEDRRGRGYHARRIDPAELLDLYRAQYILAQVAAAGALRAPVALEPGPSPSDFVRQPVGAWEHLYELLIRQANNGFLILEQRRLADRLAPARRIERTVLDEAEGDFDSLCLAMAKPGWTGLVETLKPFLRRRKAAVESLVVSMRLESAKYKLPI